MSETGSETEQLVELVRRGGVIVLSGAGISTESGIPDYRGPTGSLHARLPMTIREFVSSPAARRRYWARSQIGWPRLSSAAPNTGHRALVELEGAGTLAAIITQNVDGLHQAAGARNVIELHGSLAWVVCLECGSRTPRAALDERLRAANPGFDQITAIPSPNNPDGDVELAQQRVAGFCLVGCQCCGSDLLKPDVVFFGENVPRPRVDRCYALVGGASSLLVLGSSLTVMSGLRFVRHARQVGIPVAIINQGVTRGDPLADLKCDAPLGPTLTGLLAALATPALGLRAFVMAARAPETRPEGEGRRAPPPHRVL